MTRKSPTLRRVRAAGSIVVCVLVVWAVAASTVAQAPPVAQPAVTTASGVPQADPVTAEGPVPTTDLWGIVKKGGLLMVPLGVCSVVLLALAFERAISLRRARVIPKPFVTRFLKQLREGELDREKALELCYDNQSPVAEVFAAAVRKWGRPAVEVEQAMIDGGERATNGLRRYLRAINGLVTISPLLGLLGTVMGMIRAFNDIATSNAMGRPELLAKGISEALLTTAGGLSVAIPAVILYLYFIGRVDRLIIQIDSLGHEVVGLICGEEQHEPKLRASKPRRAPRPEAAA